VPGTPLCGWMQRTRVIFYVSGFGWVWLVATQALLVLASAALALAAMPRLARTVDHPSSGAIHAGDHVVVDWHDGSYPATILAVVGDGAYSVRYDGWSSSWDEVVGASRIASLK
jgi:hypothetical protein